MKLIQAVLPILKLWKSILRVGVNKTKTMGLKQESNAVVMLAVKNWAVELMFMSLPAVIIMRIIIAFVMMLPKFVTKIFRLHILLLDAIVDC